MQPRHASDTRWIYGLPIDLIVGCGAWSAPLLLLAGRGGVVRPARGRWSSTCSLSRSTTRTTWRRCTARTTRGPEFAKYRLFTLHITVAPRTCWPSRRTCGPPLLPWIFTLYVTWSPWHYTGQNFGLTMMFARRNGVGADRRRAAPALPRVSRVVRVAVRRRSTLVRRAILWSARSAFRSPSRRRHGRALLLLFAADSRHGARAHDGARRPGAMLAPLTLVSTQVPRGSSSRRLPVAWRGGEPVAQTRYSTGVLAVMHSAQYLWITSYYARREAESADPAGRGARGRMRDAVAEELRCSCPAPGWRATCFGVDFTESVLIVHRDRQHPPLHPRRRHLEAARSAASPRCSSTRGASAAAGSGGRRPGRPARDAVAGRRARHRHGRCASRRSSCSVGWAALDQTRFVLGTSASSD